MCGIVGVFQLNQQPVSATLVDKMNQVLTHRGPDGQGIWVEKNIGFGHRRLSIIDLSTHGHQPMMCESQRYVITYNGEVYNFRELRIELESLGHQFYSNTDTEVVLKAFAEWGKQSIVKFNGMFAFAIWDRQEQVLHLGRDRYGTKPLYYIKTNNQVIFASEIKAILKHPDVRAELNYHGVVEYLTFQNFIGQQTLFQNINILAPAHLFSIDKNKEHSWQYWDFDFNNSNISISMKEAVIELERLFKQGVNRQLVSDVELGCYLSGGLDSASITAMASKEIPCLKTFTCGFDLSSASGIEQTFDERKDAEHLSYLFKTEHYEMILKAGDMERCMHQLAYHVEEPRVGQSYPNFYAAKLASKFGKVVLAGTGGDEILAGYPWRYFPQMVHQNQDEFLKTYFNYWQRIFNIQEHSQLFQPLGSLISDFSPFERFKSIFAKNQEKSDLSPSDLINQCLYFESKTFLHGLLTIEDKISMAHSLESRVPFLDNELVDFVMRLPIQYKLGNIHQVYQELIQQQDISSWISKTNDGKQVFRQAMNFHLPKSIIQKTKQGFSAPDASWFKGESIEYVRKVLSNKKARIYDSLDYHFVQQKLNQHFSGQNNLRLVIWSLISLEKCLEIYFN